MTDIINDTYWDYKNISNILELYKFEMTIVGAEALRIKNCREVDIGNLENKDYKNFGEIMNALDLYHYHYIISYFEDKYRTFIWCKLKDLYRVADDNKNKSDDEKNRLGIFKMILDECPQFVKDVEEGFWTFPTEKEDEEIENINEDKEVDVDEVEH